MTTKAGEISDPRLRELCCNMIKIRSGSLSCHDFRRPAKAVRRRGHYFIRKILCVRKNAFFQPLKKINQAFRQRKSAQERPLH